MCVYVCVSVYVIRKALPLLENEYSFWMENRSIDVEVNSVKHVMNRYYVQVGQPR